MTNLGAEKMKFAIQRAVIAKTYLAVFVLVACVATVSIHQVSFILVSTDAHTILYYISYVVITYTITYLYLIHLFVLLSIKYRFYKLNEHLRLVDIWYTN